MKIFGDFEFDEERKQLLRGGSPVAINGQCLDLLVLMIERPGEIVTREEIRRKLWPDSHVDFDHSLDVLMNRLRIVLGDDRTSARYIQTVLKKGYRFVGPVSIAASGSEAVSRFHWMRRFAPYAAIAILAACFALVIDHTRYDKAVPHHGGRASVSSR